MEKSLHFCGKGYLWRTGTALRSADEACKDVIDSMTSL